MQNLTVGLGQSLRYCISKRLSGDVKAPCACAPLYLARARSLPILCSCYKEAQNRAPPEPVCLRSRLKLAGKNSQDSRVSPFLRIHTGVLDLCLRALSRDSRNWLCGVTGIPPPLSFGKALLGNYFTACSNVGTSLYVQSQAVQSRGCILHEKAALKQNDLRARRLVTPYI